MAALAQAAKEVAPGRPVVADRPYVVGVKCEAPPTAAAIAVLVERVEVPCFGGLGSVGLVDELAAGAAGAMTGFSSPRASWRR